MAQTPPPPRRRLEKKAGVKAGLPLKPRLEWGSVIVQTWGLAYPAYSLGMDGLCSLGDGLEGVVGHLG